ncbi:hypothetical protein ACP4OV_001350 [Aristida adscensionis]
MWRPSTTAGTSRTTILCPVRPPPPPPCAGACPAASRAPRVLPLLGDECKVRQRSLLLSGRMPLLLLDLQGAACCSFKARARVKMTRAKVDVRPKALAAMKVSAMSAAGRSP